MAALAESTGEKGDVFLDVDIDKAREKYERAKEFVEKRGLAYNLSSGRLEDLGGSELARLPELVESDYEFGGKGGIRTKAAKERIVIRLFPKVAPLATKNFRLLVTGEKGKSGKTGVMLSYKTIPFHRVIKGFVVGSRSLVSVLARCSVIATVLSSPSDTYGNTTSPTLPPTPLRPKLGISQCATAPAERR